jgi:hypothetical protein
MILNAGVVLNWIKVRETAKLDFAFGFWKLVKSCGIKLEEQDWINAASVDETETAKRDLLLEFWQQFKSSNVETEDLQDPEFACHIDAIASGIVDGTMQPKQDVWQRRKKVLSDLMEADRPKLKAQKDKHLGLPIDLYLGDVDRLRTDFSWQHSLLLAELSEPKNRYGTARGRSKVLWYILTFDFDSSKSPEKQPQLKPIECEATQQQVPEHHNRNSPQPHVDLPHHSHNGKRKHPFGEAAGTHHGKRPCLEQGLVPIGGQGGIVMCELLLRSVDPAFLYVGMGQAEESADCYLWFRWSGFTALELLSDTQYKQYTEGLWVYHEVDRSIVNKLPDKDLSRIAKESTTWRNESQNGKATTAVVRIRTPNKKIVKLFGGDIYIEVAVPKTVVLLTMLN